MKTYGYLRISTEKQDIESNKKEILMKANTLKLGNVEFIEETVSGTKHFNKRKLGELLNNCNEGDTIITSEISRIGRNIKNIMEFIFICSEKKVNIYMTKTDFKINESIESQLIVFAYSLSAQIERELISSRTKTALQHARDKGITLGRKKGTLGKLKLYKNISDIKFLLENGAKKGYIAKKYNVNNNTVTNFCKRYKL